MHVINSRNVNVALHYGARYIRAQGVRSDSRNGSVLVAPEPVTTVYQNPTERVLLDPGRDANPFFHLVESLWMIAGRDDLATLTKYVKSFVNFSDDGKTVPGAYGKRWRDWFIYIRGEETLDQLAWAVQRLRNNPDDRRVVIQMWDPEVDMGRADAGGKDVPCNLIALPTVSRDGRLDLTVYNRSNDMVWGAYGANAVHFSVLQELIAALVGVPVGRYYQVANNFHAYLATLDKAGQEWPWWGSGFPVDEPYGRGAVRPYAMFTPDESLAEVTDDIERFLDNPARVGLRSAFLRKIACPLVLAHQAWRQGDQDGAWEVLEQMPPDCDWKAGATLWFQNRINARNKKEVAK